VTEPDAAIHEIIESLNRAGIPAMLTGSFASAFHGTPRATQDIDFVIEADVDRLRRFVESLPPDRYYVDEGAALDALRDRSMFNVLDRVGGWKIDLVIRKDREFSRMEFSRRQGGKLAGRSIEVVTAEDLVIAKLEWAKAGRSERQLNDAAGILAVQAARLDRDYVQRWVRELGLEREWLDALSRIPGAAS